MSRLGDGVVLKHKWNQGADALAILGVLLAKLLDHKLLFGLRFEP